VYNRAMIGAILKGIPKIQDARKEGFVL